MSEIGNEHGQERVDDLDGGEPREAVLFVDGAEREHESGLEATVRAALGHQAAAVPLENPPVAQLRRRGRNRRRVRDSLAAVGALVLVSAAAVGVHAATAEAGGSVTSAASGMGAAGPPTAGPGGAGDPAVILRYQASVPRNWRPGPKLPLTTYTIIPKWMQSADAAATLGEEKVKGHNVNLGVGDAAQCLSFGSSPVLWPKGFYAEGSPMVVFDAHGKAVYVVNQGFTGADGPAKLGYGNQQLTAAGGGLDMSACPVEGSAMLESFAVMMIFPRG